MWCLLKSDRCRANFITCACLCKRKRYSETCAERRRISVRVCIHHGNKSCFQVGGLRVAGSELAVSGSRTETDTAESNNGQHFSRLLPVLELAPNTLSAIKIEYRHLSTLNARVSSSATMHDSSRFTARAVLLLLLVSCLLSGASATNLQQITAKLRDYTGLQREFGVARSNVASTGPDSVPETGKLPVGFTCDIKLCL